MMNIPPIPNKQPAVLPEVIATGARPIVGPKPEFFLSKEIGALLLGYWITSETKMVKGQPFYFPLVRVMMVEMAAIAQPKHLPPGPVFFTN